MDSIIIIVILFIILGIIGGLFAVTIIYFIKPRINKYSHFAKTLFNDIIGHIKLVIDQVQTAAEGLLNSINYVMSFSRKIWITGITYNF